MSISLTGTNVSQTASFSATHAEDGTLTIYPIQQGIVLTPADAVKFANYILDSQPAPEPANDTVDQTSNSDVSAASLDSAVPTIDETPVAADPILETTPEDAPVNTPVSDLTPPTADSVPEEASVTDGEVVTETPVDEVVADTSVAAPAPSGWPSDPNAA